MLLWVTEVAHNKTQKFIYFVLKTTSFEDIDIGNISISGKVSPDKKNYKYLIRYMDDDYKGKPHRNESSKNKHKVMMLKLNGCILIEDNELF